MLGFFSPPSRDRSPTRVAFELTSRDFVQPRSGQVDSGTFQEIHRRLIFILERCQPFLDFPLMGIREVNGMLRQSRSMRGRNFGFILEARLGAWKCLLPDRRGVYFHSEPSGRREQVQGRLDCFSNRFAIDIQWLIKYSFRDQREHPDRTSDCSAAQAHTTAFS